MNAEQQVAFEWAKNQKFQSVAARYAKTLADLIESLQAELDDYHHMSELVDGKMEENQRLRRINENLQAQLAASQRREKAAVEDIADMEKILPWGVGCYYCKHYAPAGGDGECGNCNFEWRGPQEAGSGGTE